MAALPSEDRAHELMQDLLDDFGLTEAAPELDETELLLACDGKCGALIPTMIAELWSTHLVSHPHTTSTYGHLGC